MFSCSNGKYPHSIANKIIPQLQMSLFAPSYARPTEIEHNKYPTFQVLHNMESHMQFSIALPDLMKDNWVQNLQFLMILLHQGEDFQVWDHDEWSVENANTRLRIRFVERISLLFILEDYNLVECYYFFFIM